MRGHCLLLVDYVVGLLGLRLDEVEGLNLHEVVVGV